MRPSLSANRINTLLVPFLIRRSEAPSPGKATLLVDTDFITPADGVWKTGVPAKDSVDMVRPSKANLRSIFSEDWALFTPPVCDSMLF